MMMVVFVSSPSFSSWLFQFSQVIKWEGAERRLDMKGKRGEVTGELHGTKTTIHI